MEFLNRIAELRLMNPETMEDVMENFKDHLGFKIVWAKNQFNQLDTLEDKFAFVWNLPEAQRYLIPPAMPSTNFKSDEMAERAKTEGNIKFRKNNFIGALEAYNNCILLAPHPPVVDEIPLSTTQSSNNMVRYRTLAFGYANRSGVFLKIKKYVKCLSDIDLALKSGYPELLKSKLIERKERCLKEQRTAFLDNSVEVICVDDKIIPVLDEPNTVIPAFSDGLKMSYSPSKGRHVVTTRDVQPGDLLVVEKSYCSIHDETAGGLMCVACFKFCSSPLPCPGCLESFCSETCRTEGLKGNHAKTCKLLTLAIAFGLGNDYSSLLALNILLRNSYVELKEKVNVLVKESMELAPEKLGFDESGLYKTDFRSVYHMPTKKWWLNQEESLFEKCLIAVVLTRMVFSKECDVNKCLDFPSSPTQRDYTMVGAILLHHMQRGFQTKIWGLKAVDGIGFNSTTGEGIFPATRLIAHSCNPNTFAYFIGDVIVVRAAASIQAGEEVTAAFFDHFKNNPKLLRILGMSSVGVTCSCRACEEGWPILEMLPSEMTFLCVKCSKPVLLQRSDPVCSDCDVNYSRLDYVGDKKILVDQFQSVVRRLKEVDQRFLKASDKIASRGSVQREDFTAIKDYIMMLERHVKQPYVYFYSAQEVMMMYFFKS